MISFKTLQSCSSITLVETSSMCACFTNQDYDIVKIITGMCEYE